MALSLHYGRLLLVSKKIEKKLGVKIMNKVWQIVTVSFVTIWVLVICGVIPAAAQTPLQVVEQHSNQQQVQQLIRQRSASPQQMPDRLVGVEAGKPVR